ncbi:MAG: aminotransferase class V-fold PLP-dependent enzyme [Magnetococcus sp. DMHC-6]
MMNMPATDLSYQMIQPSPFRKEFSLQSGLVYLNHAGVAPISRRGVRAMCAVAEHLCQLGGSRYAELNAAYESVRERCARLIQCQAREVAFIPNTSMGISFAAMGIDWQPGDEIVTTDQEFPANLVVWLDVASRFKLKLHRPPSENNGAVSVEHLLERVTPRTRVVAVSSVQFSSGAVVDLHRLGAHLANTDTLLLVDGIQSLGILPMDVQAMGIDILAADGHKWLLSPEGCGLFYLSEKAMAQVHPRVLGWHSLANAGQYDQVVNLTLRPGAKRFEAGSPNLLGVAALGAGIDLLLEASIDQVQTRVKDLVAALAQGVVQRGALLHTPLAKDGRPGAGIVVFSFPHLLTQPLHQALLQAGIEQAHRGGGIRFSPHFYQDQTDVNRALETLDLLLEPGHLKIPMR